MEAFLVTVPPLPIQLIDSSSGWIRGIVRQRLGIRTKRWTPNTSAEPQLLSMSFMYHSTSGRQYRMRKTRICTFSKTGLYATLVGGSCVITLSRIRKNARASSFYRCITTKLLYRSFFMLWRKLSKLNFFTAFIIIPVYPNWYGVMKSFFLHTMGHCMAWPIFTFFAKFSLNLMKFCMILANFH